MPEFSKLAPIIGGIGAAIGLFGGGAFFGGSTILSMLVAAVAGAALIGGAGILVAALVPAVSGLATGGFSSIEQLFSGGQGKANTLGGPSAEQTTGLVGEAVEATVENAPALGGVAALGGLYYGGKKGINYIRETNPRKAYHNALNVVKKVEADPRYEITAQDKRYIKRAVRDNDKISGMIDKAESRRWLWLRKPKERNLRDRMDTVLDKFSEQQRARQAQANTSTTARTQTTGQQADPARSTTAEAPEAPRATRTRATATDSYVVETDPNGTAREVATTEPVGEQRPRATDVDTGNRPANVEVTAGTTTDATPSKSPHVVAQEPTNLDEMAKQYAAKSDAIAQLEATHPNSPRLQGMKKHLVQLDKEFQELRAAEQAKQAAAKGGAKPAPAANARKTVTLSDGTTLDTQVHSTEDSRPAGTAEGPAAKATSNPADVTTTKTTNNATRTNVTDVPRASGAAGAGAIYTGIQRLAHGETLKEKVLGGADLADGSTEIAAVLSKSSRLSAAVPFVTAPVAALNVPFDLHHAKQAFQSGDYVEGSKYTSLAGMNTGISLDAVGRSAQVVQRTRIIQHLAQGSNFGGKTLQTMKAVGAGSKVAGRVFIPLGAVAGAVDIYRFSDASYKLAKDTKKAIQQDMNVHASGVTIDYAEKMPQLLASVVVPEIPMDKPNYTEYRQLPAAFMLIKSHLGKTQEELSQASPDQLHTYLEETYDILSKQKEKSLEKFSDSQFSFYNVMALPGELWKKALGIPSFQKVFKSNRELAKSSGGRLLLDMQNEAGQAYNYLGDGSHYTQNQKDMSDITSLDSSLRSIKTAMYELIGDKEIGALHGDVGFLSYKKRMQLHQETQRLRSEIKQQIAQGNAKELARDIQASEQYLHHTLTNTTVVDQYRQRAADNGDILHLEQQAIAYQQLSQSMGDDKVIQYKALATHRELLQKQVSLVREILGAQQPEQTQAKKFLVEDIRDDVELTALTPGVSFPDQPKNSQNRDATTAPSA